MAEPMDGRCEDYANDPAVVYHAHDLPRCKNVATVQIGGRWLCNVHARLAAVERERDLMLETHALCESLRADRDRLQRVADEALRCVLRKGHGDAALWDALHEVFPEEVPADA
jgi:hypothetical protein